MANAYTSLCSKEDRVRFTALAEAFNKLLKRKKVPGEFTAFEVAAWYSPDFVRTVPTRRVAALDACFRACIGSDTFEHYIDVARVTCAFEYQCGMGPRTSGGINVTLSENDTGDK